MASGMNPREYSTRPPARPAVGDVMAAAATLEADGRGRFRAPPVLQSWPGIVHGGGLVALLDAAASALTPDGRPRLIEGRLTSSVPIDTSLALEGHVDGGEATVTILDGTQPLSSATIRHGPVDDPALDPGWRTGGRESWPMPLSDQCLACGAHNPLGLQLGLRFDTDGVWARFLPRQPWRRPGDRLAPALAAVVLDEIAWWLGALVTKEGGLTNRIALTLLCPEAIAPGPVTAVGRFADVTPVDRRRTFWRTRSRWISSAGDRSRASSASCNA